MRLPLYENGLWQKFAITTALVVPTSDVHLLPSRITAMDYQRLDYFWLSVTCQRERHSIGPNVSGNAQSTPAPRSLLLEAFIEFRAKGRSRDVGNVAACRSRHCFLHCTTIFRTSSPFLPQDLLSAANTGHRKCPWHVRGASVRPWHAQANVRARPCAVRACPCVKV